MRLAGSNLKGGRTLADMAGQCIGSPILASLPPGLLSYCELQNLSRAHSMILANSVNPDSTNQLLVRAHRPGATRCRNIRGDDHYKWMVIVTYQPALYEPNSGLNKSRGMH